MRFVDGCRSIDEVCWPFIMNGGMEWSTFQLQKQRKNRVIHYWIFYGKKNQISIPAAFTIRRRLIMFKECLKYNIVPFIIEDNLKMFYYRGLKEWYREKRYLRDTCLTAQDKYKAYLDYFRIKYKEDENDR